MNGLVLGLGSAVRVVGLVGCCCCNVVGCPGASGVGGASFCSGVQGVLRFRADVSPPIAQTCASNLYGECVWDEARQGTCRCVLMEREGCGCARSESECDGLNVLSHPGTPPAWSGCPQRHEAVCLHRTQNADTGQDRDLNLLDGHEGAGDALMR